MRQALFVERRQAGWRRLEELLRITDRSGVQKLDPETVAEFGRLYRWVTSDLACANGREYEPSLRAYLNRLTARAHAVVYGGAAQGTLHRVWAFYGRTFPAEVRASRAPILISVGLFLAAAAVAYYLIWTQPLNAWVVLPESLVAPIRQGLHKSNFEPAVAGLGAPTLAVEIMQNNIRAAIVAFGGGLTLGALTLWILIYNGLVLGGMAAMYVAAGFGHDFWATIAPHGIIELTAVNIAAGAGLLLAAGVLCPGRLRRIDALRRNAGRAGVLILGVASMLVVAGSIEGGFTPQNFSESSRIAFGAGTAVAMLTYFLLAGRVTKAPAP
ncbi:MAG: stage II sporulation protein M [Candidatus Eremiobacteraeota bacterium]|nr:stage II sporulation protein M [Candidatus Eremiobacteraeota bacterium]